MPTLIVGPAPDPISCPWQRGGPTGAGARSAVTLDTSAASSSAWASRGAKMRLALVVLAVVVLGACGTAPDRSTPPTLAGGDIQPTLGAPSETAATPGR